MLKRLTRFVSSIEDLNTKMFWSVAVIVAIITIVSAVTTFLEGIDRICTVSLILGVIAIFLLTLVAKKFGCIGLCYMGVCLIVNEVLIPINYFTGGGLMSGMPMYFVAGITLCTFAMKNWQKRVMAL